MPIKTWERTGFTREDLIPTNLRLAAANRGAIYVAGRTPVTVLHMGGRNFWMSFLVVENLDDADQFILGRDFVRNFDVMIDLNNGLIRIRNPERKYVKKPINRIITEENKVPVFLDRKVKLQPGQAVVAIFRMRNLNSLSDSKQVCLVPNPNSQSSVILGRSFSVTRNGLCVSVLLNKHPRHEEALSGVKASKARLLSEAEARRKDKTQELAAKKMQAVTEEAREPEPATAAEDFKIDYKAAARDALKRVQQELVTKEIEQKVKLELENEKLQEQLNTFEATEFEETKTPSSLDMKLKVISGKRFGMAPQGKKIQSIISVAGHQVIRNLSEPSEFTLMHLDTYADYLRQVEPRTESRAVRALLTTGGPRMKKLHGRYLEVYGPYQIMLNVDGISIYTRTYITTDDDQMGQIYLGEEELKVRRIGHDAMMEQNAVHIGYEADVTAHLLDTNGAKIGVTGLLDTGAVVGVMPIKTWERMGFTREDLIPTNLRLAAANRGAIYVAARTPVTVLHMGGRNLWMSFLVVENLDDADQFILGRDFVRNFDVMIDLNNGLIRIRNPDRKYVKKPINRIITDENKVPVFLDRKVKLQPGQAVVAIFRMRNLNSLSDSKQVCLVPNPNSQRSVILGRSFSVTRNGLCVSVLLNTLDTTVSIQRGMKLGYALPMRTDYEETQNLKKYSVKDCPYHANKDNILKRIDELKSIHKLFSMKSETDDGLSSCSNFPERPSSYELESDKPVLPEIEHLKGKIGEGDFEKLRDLLNRNADVFSKHKADIGCCNFVEHEIELEEGAVPHREGARRMTPQKSEACRAEIEMLLEYDMIEPSKSPWACGVVMAKKNGGAA